MKILSLSIGHDASYCILQDGEILSYNSEERFSRRKHDEHLECVLNYLIEEGDINFDTVCIYHYDDIGHRQYITHLIEVLNDNFNFWKSKSRIVLNTIYFMLMVLFIILVLRKRYAFLSILLEHITTLFFLVLL